MLIEEVSAKKILNSRGEETIEVSVNGCRASSPGGKSIGKFETKPYQESLDASINSINSLQFPFDINSFADLKKVENAICKKYNLRYANNFGANALFALESAILKALAKSKNKQLWEIINPKARNFPIPVGNAIGGGLHSQKFKIHPLFQEFLIIPDEFSFKENVRVMSEIYGKIGKFLTAIEKNDEGAWQVPMNNGQALETLSKFSNQVRLGIDVAASSFFRNNLYVSKEKSLDEESQIKYINNIIEKYNIFYVEDPLQEEMFHAFSRIHKKHLVVGDDLTATQLGRLKEAIRCSSINAMIIKPNQNGSLLEVAKIIALCKENKIKTIFSHRSGETMDTSIADYAFAFGADFIKIGISTVWREAKLKRMIDIENSFHQIE
jgi:enolase